MTAMTQRMGGKDWKHSVVKYLNYTGNHLLNYLKNENEYCKV